MTGTSLVTQSYQNMEADGVFAEMPNGSDGQKLPDLLQVNLFTPNIDKDKFREHRVDAERPHRRR